LGQTITGNFSSTDEKGGQKGGSGKNSVPDYGTVFLSEERWVVKLERVIRHKGIKQQIAWAYASEQEGEPKRRGTQGLDPV